MRINHNIPALQSLFQYNKTNSALEKSLEKLSSGKRINRAADDAAGLAISNKLDAQIRGLEQANRNSNDGISLIQTAEGALNEVEAMLQRMRELAVQASNGTLAPEDREAVQKEIGQLVEEVERVSNDIEFNEMKLLNGDLDRVTFVDNKDIADSITFTQGVKSGSYSFEITGATQEIAQGGNISSLFTVGVVDAGAAGTLNINGVDINIVAGETPADVLNKLNQAGSTANFTVTASNIPLDNNESITLTNNEYGNLPFTITGDANTINALGLGSPTITPGSDVVVSNLSTDFPAGVTSTYKDNLVEFEGPDGFNLIVEHNDKPLPIIPTKVTIDILETGPLDIQIGANEGQSMEVRIPDMSSKALGIDVLNVETTSSANEALGAVDEAINTVSLVRAQLGAYQNRLEYTINNLSTATENMTASLSRIVDVDMAVEMANYTQLNVISQSGVSMIAQANQMPEQVLQLLRG